MEELNSHNRIKTALSVALTPLVEPDLGYYVSDGMRLTIPDLDLSTEPDGMVVSHASLRRGRLITASGTGAEATELIGIPDLVIEIVSPSSEEKDTDWLMESYFRAGIPEFWLIDARAKDLRFDLYRPASKGYSAIRKSAGFSKSTVLGKSVRLTRSRSSTGIATYVLNVR
jgi:Uma2 family endonuclease